MSVLAARRQPPFNVATFGIGAAVAGLASLLYLLTAARDIVGGDTPELITAAVTLRVPHPPGYPLFTMLGHLFSLLPFGPIPFRVNHVFENRVPMFLPVVSRGFSAHLRTSNRVGEIHITDSPNRSVAYERTPKALGVPELRT